MTAVDQENPGPAPPKPGVSGWFVTLENAGLATSLGLLLLIPVTEIILRATGRPGITAASSFTQHFTLFVGMLGGAIAARDNRLLSLASAMSFLKGRYKSAAAIFTGSIAATISAALLTASLLLVRQEIEGGKIIAYHIPTWSLQLVMPLGFALIMLRLWWNASEKWAGRITAFGISLLLFAGAWHLGSDGSAFDPERLLWPSLILLLTATALGAPVFTALGGAALILFWAQGRTIASVSLNHYSLVTDPTLPTIPLFTLAGYFLAEGGASRRLIEVFEVLVGRIRGGAAIVCVIVCAFFTSFTGASGVTILALGGLLMPILQAARYKERHILGLLTSSGSVGLLFAPCLPLILYAIIAQNAITLGDFELGGKLPEVTMQQMFLGGVLPGILLVAVTVAWGIWMAGKGDNLEPPEAAVSKTGHLGVGRVLWRAKWELMLPVVALGSLFSGWATAVEAAAVTAAYAFITQVIIHRDLKPRELVRVMTECGLLVGGVLLILGVAMGLTKFLIFEDIPILALEWITEHIDSKILFLLCLNIFLLLVGCLMDIFSAIVVIVPLLIPVGLAFGIDPVHLGIIFLANLELGYLTPPVGLNLFIASYRFNKPLPVLYRSVIPILCLRFVAVILITYLPWISTWLPRTLFG